MSPSCSVGWSPSISFAESCAPCLEPVLPPSGGLGAKDQETKDPGEADPEQTGNNAAADRFPVGVGHFREPLRTQIDLFVLHRRDLVTNRIHVLLTAVALHDRERRGRPLVLTQIDRLFKLAKLAADALFQSCKAILLRGIVDRQSPQRVEAQSDFPCGRAIWLEVSFLTGQQIAALASFGVFHRGKHALQCGQHVTASDNEGAVRFQGLEIEVRDSARREKENDSGDQAQPDQRI